ncbi:MAG: peptidyl-prolyl cis-trans isomerase, partial [Candidatus Eisenbacteria bacterium]|nr:peptidyl-prolyl cis-trans isomerase [Candidatus Eisenbacteria bacterium]
VSCLASMAWSQTEGKPRVEVKTTQGDIVLELEPEKAPVTVENFLKYVNSGFYKGTIFHRVIDGFMIQGGGFTIDMKKKTTPYPAIKLESRNGLKNKKYTVAMARTNVPDSATSQFFINVVDNPRLDYPNPDGHGYAVFGTVISGEDVVDKIRAVKTTTKNGYEDVPMEAVMITGVSLLDSEGDSH